MELSEKHSDDSLSSPSRLKSRRYRSKISAGRSVAKPSATLFIRPTWPWTRRITSAPLIAASDLRRSSQGRVPTGRARPGRIRRWRRLTSEKSLEFAEVHRDRWHEHSAFRTLAWHCFNRNATMKRRTGYGPANRVATSLNAEDLAQRHSAILDGPILVSAIPSERSTIFSEAEKHAAALGDRPARLSGSPPQGVCLSEHATCARLRAVAYAQALVLAKQLNSPTTDIGNVPWRSDSHASIECWQSGCGQLLPCQVFPTRCQAATALTPWTWPSNRAGLPRLRHDPQAESMLRTSKKIR